MVDVGKAAPRYVLLMQCYGIVRDARPKGVERCEAGQRSRWILRVQRSRSDVGLRCITLQCVHVPDTGKCSIAFVFSS